MRLLGPLRSLGVPGLAITFTGCIPLAESIDMYRLLGPLPETRWLDESDAKPATERTT